MAKQQAVWGIDIGQCALKALRCVLGENGQVVAEAFDYIPYPKSLSQPDAQPEEIVRESLQQFLSRNRVRGDKVAMSVSGQSGLARFFRPPASDPKLLPSLVKYEAKQQIPFQIDEVVWDWQQIGGYVSDGQLSEAEVGLFAMKRETVYRSMQPFIDAKVEVDFVQLSPIATYNMICHDMLKEIPNPEEIDPENPPPYHLIISIGTDSTDVVITNGNRLWLRNIALGGNHFTKQLSREMKLTHAKAEQLKRNARKAENPKEIFKAMRPVFSDMGDELARSLNYFRSIDRNAEFDKVMLMGNASLLPGLRQYLETQIDQKIDRFESFSKLDGSNVLGQKSFAGNVRAFAPCYGLCIQALGESKLTTNLLPQEFIVEKVVRAKKPWVLCAVALVMMGVAVGHFLGSKSQFDTSDPFVDSQGVKWADVKRAASSTEQLSNKFKQEDTELAGELDSINNLLNRDLVGPTTEKTQVLQIISVIGQLVPKDTRPIDKTKGDEVTNRFHGREDIYLDQVSPSHYSDVKEWFNDDLQKKFRSSYGGLRRNLRPGEPNPLQGLAVDAADTGEIDDFGGSGGTTVVEGEGWVVHLKGHHYANGKDRVLFSQKTEADYISHSLVKNFYEKEITLGGQKFLPSDLGISYPTIIKHSTADFTAPGLKKKGGMGAGEVQNSGGGKNGIGGSLGSQENDGRDRDDKNQVQGGDDKSSLLKRDVELKKTDFELEFLWRPVTLQQAIENRDKRLEIEKNAAAQVPDNAEGGNPDGNPDGA